MYGGFEVYVCNLIFGHICSLLARKSVSFKMCVSGNRKWGRNTQRKYILLVVRFFCFFLGGVGLDDTFMGCSHQCGWCDSLGLPDGWRTLV